MAVFGVVLTPEQILRLAEDAVGFRRVLSQFAFGGRWYSAIYFMNGGTSTVAFPVGFLRDAGHPLQVPSINGSSTTIILPPGGSAAIEAPNIGQLMQGYVSAVLPVGATGYGVFRQSVPGVADQEAVVPLSPADAKFQSLLFDETNGLVTAAAALRSMPGLSQIVGKRGTVRFSVPPQPGFVSVLGLRFNGQAFTSIPASGKARSDF